MSTREFNPVLQFRAEAVARKDDRWHVLAGGAWLVCTQPEINADGRIFKNMTLFRDYWTLYCYDDACQAALDLRAIL